MLHRTILLLAFITAYSFATTAISLGQQPQLSPDIKDSSSRLSRLIAIVLMPDDPNCDLAIRTLAKMEAEAQPSIPALCLRLDDRRYWTRSNAVDALVAIGDASVTSLRESLQAPSSRCRGAAATALGRLGRLQLEEIDQLAKNDDLRVRAAVTEALATLGKPAVAQLVVLLSDSDTVVAVEATRGLGDNHEDASAAIAALIESLPRPHVGWDVAAEVALEHIGPPHEDDIPLLCECLSHSDMEARILAADRLAMMGTTAKGTTVRPKPRRWRHNGTSANCGTAFGAHFPLT